MKNRTIVRLNQRWKDLDGEYNRGWRDTHMKVQEVILPRRGRFLLDERNRGERRGTKMVDSTGLQANDTCAAGMLTGLTSPARPWMRLTLENRMGEETHEERVALDRWRNLMLLIFQASNTYGALYNIYLECAGFGTAFALLYPDFDNVIRIHVHTAGEYRLGSDNTGRVHEAMVETKWTAEQIADEFLDGPRDSIERFPMDLQNALRHNPLTPLNVRHYVGPNEGDEGGFGQRGKPYVSDYWLDNTKDDEGFLARRGFSYNPILAPRWQTMGHDAYGRGPGMNALADCAMLQAMQRNKLRGIEKQVDPPTQGPGWMNDRQTDLRPGAHNVRDGSRAHGGDDKITSLYDVQLNLSDLSIEIERTRDVVRQMYFNHVFALFSGQGMKDVRERAIEEMAEEKLLQLGPVVSAFTVDLLDPAVDGTFSIMSDASLLGDLPESMQGENIKVDYISILAQAQKAQGLGQIDRFLAMVGRAAEVQSQGGQRPADALDRVGFDELIEDYAEQTGIAARGVRDADVVAAEREARDQAAAQDRELAQVREGAAAVKDLGQAEVAPEESALSALVGGLSG